METDRTCGGGHVGSWLEPIRIEVLLSVDGAAALVYYAGHGRRRNDLRRPLAAPNVAALAADGVGMEAGRAETLLRFPGRGTPRLC